MYPDLSYILHALIGTDQGNWTSIIKTFGFFLALVFLVGGFFFHLEVKRKEKEGLLQGVKENYIQGGPASISSIITNALIGLVLGAKIPYIASHFDEFKLDGAGVLFSSKGNLLTGLLGAAAFGFYTWWEGSRNGSDKPIAATKIVMPHERTMDLVILAAISGIVGSKIFAIIETLDEFWKDPIGMFFSGSGMAVYGGLIGAFVVLYFYVRKKNIAPLHLMDAAAPSLILGYAIGRLGCHFSGDGDWGIVSELASRPGWLAWLPDTLWSFDYPYNVIREGVPIEGCEGHYCRRLPNPVYPTSVYETTFGVLAFGLLWFLRKKIKIAGVLFFLYLTINGFERYFIEKIRVNDRYTFLGFESTQAQIIAMGFISVGLSGIFYLWWRHRKNASA